MKLSPITQGIAMLEADFRYLIMVSNQLKETYPDSEYLIGYQLGLRRNYNGQDFGDYETHEKWAGSLVNKEEAMTGYRAGFAGKAPVLRTMV
jgi:hypothetical protein